MHTSALKIGGSLLAATALLFFINKKHDPQPRPAESKPAASQAQPPEAPVHTARMDNPAGKPEPASPINQAPPEAFSKPDLQSISDSLHAFERQMQVETRLRVKHASPSP